jgi:transposase InsO family protein
VLALIDEARKAGARQSRCCVVLGLDSRTVQRWRHQPEDGRTLAKRPKPANALSDDERAKVLAVACSPRFRDLAPPQIVAQLADEGVYIASESTFYRVLRAEKLDRHRSHARPAVHSKPPEKIATGPNQVWSWDISYLRGPGHREFFYLYVVIDIWSRKIVAAEVHLVENGDLAAKLVYRAYMREGAPEGLVLHSDRGAPMKSAPLLGLLEHLSIRPSFSRPRVSDDNPFSEALFRTVKYRPSYPRKPFQRLDAAKVWVVDFVDWYNHCHRHSGIGFVTPEQRHTGADVDLLEKRRAVYQDAKQSHPERWTTQARAWPRPSVVALNPSHLTREALAS